jgi:predicted ester cyclase
MTPEEQASIVRRFIEEAWNRGDLSVADETHAPSYRYHAPSTPESTRTHEDLRRQITRLRADYPDLHISIEDEIAAGDKVVVRYALRGTNTAQGKPVSITGVNIYRFEGGRVVEYWGHADNLNLRRQLGELPAPTQASG